MKKLKIIIILLLIFLPVINMPAISLEGEGSDTENTGLSVSESEASASVTEKDEVIYARLSSDGKAQNVYTVNHFVLAESGSFCDYGNYSSVVNLTDIQPIAFSNGTTEIKTAGENFYYQGYLENNDLPWIYIIEYYLGGEKFEPDELAGKSGGLEIKIKSVKDEKINEIFYNNYMQQITVMLKIDKCNNIKSDGATVANAGKNRMLVFTVMPKHDADITITAEVMDFEMAGIEITAMPFSMNIELPDTDNMIEEFTLLAEAITELNDGVGKLKDGASELNSGSEKLKNGSSDFNGGLTQLSANSTQITDASSQIKDALYQIVYLLKDADNIVDMSELIKLPGALTQLSDGLSQVSEGMIQLKEGYALAYAALDEAIINIPDYQLTENQLFGLYLKADDTERELILKMGEIYIAAMTVKGTYEQIQTAFAAVIPTLETLSGSVDFITGTLKDISGQINDALSGIDISAQINQLADGMAELSGNYDGFHDGLVLYINGVAELSAAYSEVDDGMAGLNDGISEISAGISELNSGTEQLADETSGMPERIKNEIDNLTSEYTSSNFEAVSFMSEKNENVSFVQFVFKADGIEKPKTEKRILTEEKQLNFWDRLVNLFVK